MSERYGIRPVVLLAGVACAAVLGGGPLQASPRCALEIDVTQLAGIAAGGVVLVEGGNGEGGDTAPALDDGTMWAGGSPDFCEACGGEVIDPGAAVEGGEGTAGDGLGEVDADGGAIDTELVDPMPADPGAPVEATALDGAGFEAQSGVASARASSRAAGDDRGACRGFAQWLQGGCN